MTHPSATLLPSAGRRLALPILVILLLAITGSAGPGHHAQALGLPQPLPGAQPPPAIDVSLSGRVTNAQGQPLSGISVSVFEAVSGIFYKKTASTATTTAGQFSLTVPANSYRIAYSDPAGVYAPQWFNGATGSCAAQTVVANSNLTNLNAVMGPALPPAPAAATTPPIVLLPEAGPATARSPVQPLPPPDTAAAAVTVKFREDTAPRLDQGRFAFEPGRDTAALNAALARRRAAAPARLFSRDAGELAAERARARNTGQDTADLTTYFRIEAPSVAEAEALVQELLALPEVETAYLAPTPLPPPGFPDTPDYMCQQGYLGAAPGGLGISRARAYGGGDGARVAIADVEYAWTMSHEDVSRAAGALVYGVEYTAFGRDHGTAVTGILAADANLYGVTGGAYGTTLRLVSPCGSVPGSCVYNPADAINRASALLQPGDVILLEQQAAVCGGTSSSYYGPLEWLQDVFDAVKAATAAGRIVVAAAGNGGLNLDSSACQGKFNRAQRDSGAIIVGAGGAPGSSADLTRLSFSSYGSRIDLQGWGERVATTGYGSLTPGQTDPNKQYTAGFNGTSSASATVAAAVAQLSSILKAAGVPATPAVIRAALAETGTPQVSPASGNIGPRPDVMAALHSLLPDSDGDGYDDWLEASLGKNANAACATMRADIDYDREVSITDLARVAAGFLTSPAGTAGRLDQNGDGRITIADLSRIAAEFLKPVSSCP